MDNPQEAPTLRVVVDDQTAQGEFVNFANIIHSPSEFVLDLGRIMPGRPEVKVYSRLIMTPLHVKLFLKALEQNISIFESKFGVIRLHGTEPYGIAEGHEPSN